MDVIVPGTNHVTVASYRLANGRSRAQDGIAVLRITWAGWKALSEFKPMTPPKNPTYDFRIIEWQVFTPDEQERLYMQLLTSESMEVSDAMRKLILKEWPELAHKLAPKTPKAP